MNGRDKLIVSLDELENTLLRSANLTDADFNDHRKAAIEQRRQIAVRRSEVAGLIDEIIDMPELHSALRARFSELCSSLATHQAAWPIVAINPENPSYQASRKSARASYRAFFEWSRSALRQPRP